jgi:hypothetical protein
MHICLLAKMRALDVLLRELEKSTIERAKAGGSRNGDLPAPKRIGYLPPLLPSNLMQEAGEEAICGAAMMDWFERLARVEFNEERARRIAGVDLDWANE